MAAAREGLAAVARAVDVPLTPEGWAPAAVATLRAIAAAAPPDILASLVDAAVTDGRAAHALLLEASAAAAHRDHLPAAVWRQLVDHAAAVLATTAAASVGMAALPLVAALAAVGSRADSSWARQLRIVCDQLLLDRTDAAAGDATALRRLALGSVAWAALPLWTGTAPVDALVCDDGPADSDGSTAGDWTPWRLWHAWFVAAGARAGAPAEAQVAALAWAPWAAPAASAALAALVAAEVARQPQLVAVGGPKLSGAAPAVLSSADLPGPVSDIVRRLLMLAVPTAPGAAGPAASIQTAVAAAAVHMLDRLRAHLAKVDAAAWLILARAL